MFICVVNTQIMNTIDVSTLILKIARLWLLLLSSVILGGNWMTIGFCGTNICYGRHILGNIKKLPIISFGWFRGICVKPRKVMLSVTGTQGLVAETLTYLPELSWLTKVLVLVKGINTKLLPYRLLLISFGHWFGRLRVFLGGAILDDIFLRVSLKFCLENCWL